MDFTTSYDLLRKIVCTMNEIKLMNYQYKSPTQIDLPSTFVEQLLFTSAFKKEKNIDKMKRKTNVQTFCVHKNKSMQSIAIGNNF